MLRYCLFGLLLLVISACTAEPVLNLDRRSSYQSLKNKFSQERPFDLIFLDPPYEKKLAETALTMVEETGLLAPNGTVVVEERRSETLTEQIGTMKLVTRRQYGETGIWIYTNA